MNRIEIVGLFTALERFCQKKDIESISQVVAEVLREARTEARADKSTKAE